MYRPDLARLRGIEMRNLLALLALLASSVAAGAQTVERIKILEFGVFERRVVETVPTPGVATGKIRIADNFKLLQPGDTIVSQLGTSFGIHYQTVGKSKGQVVNLTWITRFPSEGLSDPKNGHFHFNEFGRTHTIGNDTYRTYTFDEPWEMVPGEWTLEFWDGPKKVGEQRFRVILPPTS